MSRVNTMTSTSSHPGTLHRIPIPSTPGQLSHLLTAFEHIPTNVISQSKNTLIFLGGLFDGLLTVPFVPPIVSTLPPSWSVVEPVLSSAYRQSGFTTLDENVAQIAQVVEYFRQSKPHGNVVLLGHSTGSQQVMHYLLSENKLPPIDGGILQSGISDRELLTSLGLISREKYDSACKLAQSYVDKGQGDDILPYSVTRPAFQSAPVSARRWLSLASPGPLHDGEDDYFSSDFDDQRLAKTFGKMGKGGMRLMFLFGGADQYVPGHVDREKLVGRWHHHVRQGGGIIDEGSGIVEKASHTLEEGGEGMDDLVARVVAFLKRENSRNVT